MPDLFADVEAFMSKFGVDYDGPPRDLPFDLAEFRISHMGEELDEYISWTFPNGAPYSARKKIEMRLALCSGAHEHGTVRRAEQLDALVDLVYVTLQTARKHGFNFYEAWRRVHAANMMKQATPDGKGKGGIIKPPGWVAPDHRDLV